MSNTDANKQGVPDIDLDEVATLLEASRRISRTSRGARRTSSA